jgi:oligo-1,6-glucosidase
MLNWRPEDAEMYEDVQTRYTYAHSNLNKSPEVRLQKMWRSSRDSARTPVQWDGSKNAGFTTGKPWMKLNPRYKEINLEADRASEDSVFAYYRKLTDLRKSHPAIIDGELQFFMEYHPQLLVYTRACEDEVLLVVANYSGEETEVNLPCVLANAKWRRLLSNTEGEAAVFGKGTLAPWEVEVYTMG